MLGKGESCGVSAYEYTVVLREPNKLRRSTNALLPVGTKSAVLSGIVRTHALILATDFIQMKASCG